MGMRTVRLDDETERVLKQLTQTTDGPVYSIEARALGLARSRCTRNATRSL